MLIGIGFLVWTVLIALAAYRFGHSAGSFEAGAAEIDRSCDRIEASLAKLKEKKTA